MPPVQNPFPNPSPTARQGGSGNVTGHRQGIRDFTEQLSGRLQISALPYATVALLCIFSNELFMNNPTIWRYLTLATEFNLELNIKQYRQCMYKIILRRFRAMFIPPWIS